MFWLFSILQIYSMAENLLIPFSGDVGGSFLFLQFVSDLFCTFAPGQNTKTIELKNVKQKSRKNAMLWWWLPDGLESECEERLCSETKLLNWLNPNACVYLPLYKRLQLSPYFSDDAWTSEAVNWSVCKCMQFYPSSPRTKQTTARLSETHNSNTISAHVNRILKCAVKYCKTTLAHSVEE